MAKSKAKPSYGGGNYGMTANLGRQVQQQMNDAAHKTNKKQRNALHQHGVKKAK